MLIVFALTVTSILAVIGVLFTFGQVLDQKRVLQTAADAASLSGSWQVLQELASGDLRDDAANSAVATFATTVNGLPSDVLAAFYVDGTGVLLSPLAQVGAFHGTTFPLDARGVQVTVTRRVATILPAFLGGSVTVLVSATATAQPTNQAAASLVLPIAVSMSDAQRAYSVPYTVSSTTVDLFGPNARTLDLTTTKRADQTPNPALSYGSPATNARFWSDGLHSGSWQMTQLGSVNLADALYHAEIALGLSDAVTHQALNDASAGADKAYALVTVPVYDSATPTSIHVAGFAELKIARRFGISAAGVTATFVPYATAAWGTPSVPGTDFGAALVLIVP